MSAILDIHCAVAIAPTVDVAGIETVLQRYKGQPQLGYEELDNVGHVPKQNFRLHVLFRAMS